MTVTAAMFYLFAVLTVGSAVLVVTTRNVVYAAFSLMLTLCSVACLYVMLHADFLAATQVIIYVGGILVLVLFGVMMTSGKLDMKLRMERGRLIPGSLVGLILLALLIRIIYQSPWQVQDTNMLESTTKSTTQSIGESILGQYLLPFEIVSVILLVALIGAVLISRKEVKEIEES